MPNHTTLYSDTGFVSLLVPAVRNADANSSGLDMKDCQDATVLVYLGDSADTLSGTNKIEIELEESDDNSTYTDVANTDLTNYVTATNPGTFALVDAPTEDQAVFAVGYRGNKRYVRAVLNFSGTHTTGTPCAVLGLRGRNRANPVNALT